MHRDFGDDGENQPFLFELHFSVPVEPALARTYVSDYIPEDTRILETYDRPADDSSVSLYHSDWLATAMDGPWVGAEPGSFLAIYYWSGESASNGIVSVLIGTGHNP